MGQGARIDCGARQFSPFSSWPCSASGMSTPTLCWTGTRSRSAPRPRRPSTHRARAARWPSCMRPCSTRSTGSSGSSIRTRALRVSGVRRRPMRLPSPPPTRPGRAVPRPAVRHSTARATLRWPPSRMDGRRPRASASDGRPRRTSSPCAPTTAPRGRWCRRRPASGPARHLDPDASGLRASAGSRLGRGGAVRAGRRVAVSTRAAAALRSRRTRATSPRSRRWDRRPAAARTPAQTELAPLLDRHRGAELESSDAAGCPWRAA